MRTGGPDDPLPNLSYSCRSNEAAFGHSPNNAEGAPGSPFEPGSWGGLFFSFRELAANLFLGDSLTFLGTMLEPLKHIA